MISERFAIIIIYCVLFGLYPANSWATKQRETIEAGEINRNLKTVYFSQSSSIGVESDFRSQNTIVYLKANIEPQKIAQINTSSSASEATINSSWYWVAMGVTSGVSLFLLWLLFKKPQHLKESPVESKTENSQLEQNNITSIAHQSSDRAASLKKTPNTSQVEPNINSIDELIQNLPELNSSDRQHPSNAIVSPKTTLGRKIIIKSDPDLTLLSRNYSNFKIDCPVSAEESKANLHLVANLLAELDTDE